MGELQPQQVEAKEGDGALDAIANKYDGEKYAHRDERADTKTTFWERDIDQMKASKRRKKRMKRLMRRQEGSRMGESYMKNQNNREQQNRNEWKRRLVHTYVAQLDMTRHQKERTKHLIKDVIDINSFGHYSTEEVILAVINVVAREDGRWIEDEEMFRKLADDAGLDLTQMRRLRELVHERLPSYGT
jgi:hypothetical protein